MKRILLAFFVAAILMTVVAVPALAAYGDSSGATIQILVPDVATPVVPKLYPRDVRETYTQNGSRMIVKTYDLNPDEAPGDIPRGNFDREGWHYELTEITRDGNTYTANFIGVPLDSGSASPAAAQSAPMNSMALTLIIAAAALLVGISLGYFSSKGRKK